MSKITILAQGSYKGCKLNELYTDNAKEICAMTTSSELSDDDETLTFTVETTENIAIFDFISEKRLKILRMKPYYE